MSYVIEIPTEENVTQHNIIIGMVYALLGDVEEAKLEKRRKRRRKAV